MNKILNIAILIITLCLSCKDEGNHQHIGPLKVSDNGRFLEDSSGNPFFWLGDTGWLLFKKLDREDAGKYLENRKQKGFNVIQAVVIHEVDRAVNIYGDSALMNEDISNPLMTQGNNFSDPKAYDYWDHIDYIIDMAAEKGLYMALVPVWGTNVKKGYVNRQQASAYGKWLAERYRDKPNIIWLNGGDMKGSDSTEAWNALGYTLRNNDPDHLISFHPFGRTQSSMWFHDQPWLDFNMCQSGHRRYDQDDTELAYGEDNWRYISADYNLTSIKPTIDGEPSYEGIPQGLHDTLQPYWTDKDVRRYAYWSVFAGAFGHTYGHNAIIQFYKPTDTIADYGPKIFWEEAMEAPGACQMIHLKNLMLSRPFFDRIPDQSIVGDSQGLKYDYQAATRGENHAFIYTYNGRNIIVNMGKISGNMVRASWFDPRNGTTQLIGEFENTGSFEFDPPGDIEDGNDWVLILDSVDKEVFLFSSFREPATDGLYLAYSFDGYKWSDLGGPYIKPEVGMEKVMRDPSIIRGKDGIFHMVWTSSWKGDKGFGYACSEDLVNWSEQKFIPVMEHEPTTVNVWAPELFYDDESGNYIIIWASTIPFRFEKGIEEEENNHRMYYTTTKDFQTFSETRLFLDPGFSVIDAVIVCRGKGDYVLALKDNTRSNRNLRIGFGDNPLGPYSDITEPVTRQFTEGPTVLKLGEEWLIYYDAYRDKTYGAIKTGDFKTFTDVSDQISVPEGHKHGTIFMADEKILEGLGKSGFQPDPFQQR